jgi:hypothetical protein
LYDPDGGIFYLVESATIAEVPVLGQ